MKHRKSELNNQKHSQTVPSNKVTKKSQSNNRCNNHENKTNKKKILDNGIAPTRNSSSNFALVFITLTSFITRFYDIHKPDHVCWDETHFGKMASWYLNRTFFFDVHPPLGKMLIAFSGHVTGYDGTFSFDKPGDKYDHFTQYLGMRIFCATLGMFVPVFVYMATRSITKSNHTASLAAILIVFDNGMITLTRYILLDPPLLFFISASILGFAKFSFELGPDSDSTPFSLVWWFWLIWTGVSISCAFSVKFVGLFIVALIGLRTAYDLWVILGDISKPITYFVQHLSARVLGLIIIPVLLYITFFWIHLRQLDHTGSGDGFYSSSFQSQLIGNSLHNSSWPAHLAYGAEITIKNNRIGGAYLHSHSHLYPEGVGARQQQVTTYSHKDSNNKWFIKRGISDTPNDDIFVRNGDLIRLEHVITKRNLHSHFQTAPITKRHYQVTCYGENGLGDANDIWRIQKESYMTVSESEEDDRIYTVKTRFRLVHYLTQCALHSHSKQLPKWAYEQLEVTCNPKMYDKNNYWNIEDNFYPSLPNVSFEAYAPSFFERFLESHAVMLQGNSGLKPKEGEVTSRPWQWPINYRGQFFSASKGHKIYLLGNPIVWWTNICMIPLSTISIICLSIRDKLKSLKQSKAKINGSPEEDIHSSFVRSSSWILIGWLLHYVPFYFMGRILYFHHYFPAFIFSCIQTCITYKYIMNCISTFTRISRFEMESHISKMSFLLILVVIYTFTKFFPLTYGTNFEPHDGKESNETVESWRHQQQLSSLKWLDSWEF